MAEHQLGSLPLSAQEPISAAMGAHKAAYQVTSSAGVFQAVNPSQSLRERFLRTGVLITSGRTRVGFRLTGMGLASSLQPVGAASLGARANRVTYHRAGVSEWYANGPAGLEQGFTVSRPRRSAGDATLTLGMRLSGNARASLGRGGQILTLSHLGGPSLSYGDLVARDARGRRLHSRLQLSGNRLLLRVSLEGARFPLRIDPLAKQSELTASGSLWFGASVALSANGNTALIGAPTGGNGPGATAWVFTREGSVWTQQQQLLPEGLAGPRPDFGDKVSLSADGNTAIVSGYFNDEGVGAVWIFTREGSIWTEQQKIIGAEETGTHPDFGFGLALSPEGNTLLVTSPFDGATGAAWVFTREGSTWTEQQKLTGAGESGKDGFGYSAALGDGGNTALIGGRYNNEFEGAAWVFTREGSTWTEQQKLTGAGLSPHGNFGQSVALSTNGNVALIGGATESAGAAWVFTREGATWTEQQRFSPSGKHTGLSFGSTVALNSAGTTALVDAQFYKESQGAVWVFSREGSTWTQGKKLMVRVPPKSYFGDGLALSEDGKTALIGAPADGNGSAWVFHSRR